jgi:hypothetical protein
MWVFRLYTVQEFMQYHPYAGNLHDTNLVESMPLELIGSNYSACTISWYEGPQANLTAPAKLEKLETNLVS